MYKVCMIFLASVMICFISISAIAAPVEIPTSVKEMKPTDYIDKDANISAALEFNANFLDERELDEAEGEIDATFYTANVVLSFDRVDIYAGLGIADDIDYSAMVKGASLTYELEQSLTWSVGVNGFLYEWENSGIRIFGDLKYRAIQDMDYNNVVLEGVRYGRDDLTGAKSDAEWNEWHAALGASKKFEYLMPYAGIRYSDIDVAADVTILGTNYDLGSPRSAQHIGLFAGCSATPLENLSIDLQGTIMDEDAFSIEVAYQF